jgi:hypothetical protein
LNLRFTQYDNKDNLTPKLDDGTILKLGVDLKKISIEIKG